MQILRNWDSNEPGFFSASVGTGFGRSKLILVTTVGQNMNMLRAQTAMDETTLS